MIISNLLRHGQQNQLNLGLKRVLIESEMPEERGQHEVGDIGDILVCENEDLERWPLSAVLLKDLL